MRLLSTVKKKTITVLLILFWLKKGKKGREYFMKNTERGEKGISFKMLCIYKYYMANFIHFAYVRRYTTL